MKLALLDDNGKTIKEYDLPEPILNALYEGLVDIKTVYIGWDTNQGVLRRTTKTEDVMTENPSRKWGDAGQLNITLSFDVVDRDNEGFLPYMTYQERKEKGFTK